MSDLTQMLGVAPSREASASYLHRLIQSLADQMPATDDRGEQKAHYNQARRIVSVILHRDAAQIDVEAALEACEAIRKINAGNCLIHMYGYKNTPENRYYWLDYERQNFTNAIRDLTSAIPEKVPA